MRKPFWTRAVGLGLAMGLGLTEWLGQAALSAAVPSARGLDLIAPAAAQEIAAAQDPEDSVTTRSFRFRFFVGGVRVGDARVTTTLSDDAYSARTRLRTGGVAEWVYEADFLLSAEGGRGEEGTKPDAFFLEGLYDGESLLLEMAFESDAPADVVVEPEFRRRRWDIDPAEQNGVLDPISAVVEGLFPTTPGQYCDRTLPVFDGRRRYDFIIGESRERRDSDAAERGATVYECPLRVRRVAGFKPKFLERPDIELMLRFEIAADGEATPLRLWGDTQFGTFIISLRR